MKNAHLKYIVGGVIIVGGIVGGVIAGMRKNEEEATPDTSPSKPPAPAPKPAPKPTGTYIDAADRDRRIHDATLAAQSGDVDAIKAALARLSPEDRATAISVIPGPLRDLIK